MKTIFSNYFFLCVLMLAINKINLASPINSFINNVSPAQNAINAGKSSDITIVFVQNMNAATVNNSTIRVFGLQTGIMPVTVSYNDGTKTATINPNSDSKMGEIISVSLTSGIQTNSATPITPFNFIFTVQAIGGKGTFTQISLLDSANHISASTGVVIRSKTRKNQKCTTKDSSHKQPAYHFLRIFKLFCNGFLLVDVSIL